MCSVWLTEPHVALAARDSARAAGFELTLLADRCRSSRWAGLVVGVGSRTDDELTRTLDVLVDLLCRGAADVSHADVHPTAR